MPECGRLIPEEQPDILAVRRVDLTALDKEHQRGERDQLAESVSNTKALLRRWNRHRPSQLWPAQNFPRFVGNPASALLWCFFFTLARAT